MVEEAPVNFAILSWPDPPHSIQKCHNYPACFPTFLPTSTCVPHGMSQLTPSSATSECSTNGFLPVLPAHKSSCKCVQRHICDTLSQLRDSYVSSERFRLHFEAPVLSFPFLPMQVSHWNICFTLLLEGIDLEVSAVWNNCESVGHRSLTPAWRYSLGNGQ